MASPLPESIVDVNSLTESNMSHGTSKPPLPDPAPAQGVRMSCVEAKLRERCVSTTTNRRDAPMSRALVCRSITAMVRPCQCSSKVAASASKFGRRVDVG